MNVYKKQTLQKLVVDQAGADKLILNDIILGREGAEIIAQLIPQYHFNIVHLEIKGNNIDAQGFEMLFMSLMNCPHIKSIQAEWNNIGSSPAGLVALVYLVQNLHFLELVDLKNNKITHQLAPYIADLIQINNKSLTVLDLRWNQLGQIGAQTIFAILPYNSALKYIGLEDNRMSAHSLLQINELIKNTARGTLANRQTSNLYQTMNNQQTTKLNSFPISDDAYPSMDVQVKTGQIRSKIESEQQQALLQQEKLQSQIQRTLQKVRVRGTQIHQIQLKYDSLSNQNANLINHLRESQRLLTLQKERFFGVDKNLNSEKSKNRAQKFNLNVQIQAMMQKTMLRHQRQIEDLNTVMSQKFERLQIYLRDRLTDKRKSRDKLAEINEDIIKFKLNKQSVWDKVSITGHKGSWEDQCLGLEQLIAKAQSSLKSEHKKGEYLAEELTNIVMRGLKKEEKYEKDIFGIQNKIKDLHRQMTIANVDIEENQCKIALSESNVSDLQATVDLRRRYIKYIQSQNNVNLQIERLKHDEDGKADRLADQTLQLRIEDVEKAVRQQQAQNKMIHNQYQKILVQLQSLSKRTIHSVLFDN